MKRSWRNVLRNKGKQYDSQSLGSIGPCPVTDRRMSVRGVRDDEDEEAREKEIKKERETTSSY